MVVMVLRAELTHIMVDVADRKLCFNPFAPHRFEQQKRRRSGRVLAERLVYPNADSLTGGESTVDKVLRQYFIQKTLTQLSFLRICRVGRQSNINAGRRQKQINR